MVFLFKDEMVEVSDGVVLLERIERAMLLL